MVNLEAIYNYSSFVRNIYAATKYRSEVEVFRPAEAAGDFITKGYVINLDRRPSRWKKCARELQNQKVIGDTNLLNYCERFSAVDGQTLDPLLTFVEVEKQYSLGSHLFVEPDLRASAWTNVDKVKIDMTMPEIAVCMSHLNIWRKIVEQQIDYALILEDDIFFHWDFARQLNQAWQELPTKNDSGFRFDLLYLSYQTSNQGLDAKVYSKSLFRPIRGLWWASGYVLSYAGAKKLLALLPIVGPVDLWLNHQFRQLDVLATSNSLIAQRYNWKTDNKHSAGPLNKFLDQQGDQMVA